LNAPRPDDDQVGSFIVGQLCQPLGGNPEHCPKLRALHSSLSHDVLEQGLGSFHVGVCAPFGHRRPELRQGCHRGVREGWNYWVRDVGDDIGDDESRAEPARKLGRDA
jgi:hypothetical protein